MLTDKLFIICGLSRLAARVARSLSAHNANVVVVMFPGENESLAQMLPEGVHLRHAAGEGTAQTLRSVGIEHAECMLAVAEEDLVNLRSTVCARSVAPDVPVVIRAFDPNLADQFELGLNVRRAFSVSALAAPAFVAAACGADVIESLRLGDEVVPFNRLVIRDSSRLLGLSIAQLQQDWEVFILSWKRKDCDQVLATEIDPTITLRDGDEIILCGTQRSCLNALAFAAGWHHRRKLNQAHGRRGFTVKARSGAARRSVTLLPRLAGVLLAIVLSSIFIFQKELHLRLVDAIYFVITTVSTTGYGDISLRSAPDWVKLYGGLVMLSGGALLAVAFSYLVSVASAERLDVTMSRRASHMTNHIVIIGLGNVGYRVSLALAELGLDVVVLDLAPKPRFFDAVSMRAPVITGDARLPETLERIGVREAAAVIACTSDDLANIEACLHARRLNPDVHTVARVFDDQIVETLSSAFSIDSVLSATHAAESSFVMAATDASALRMLRIGDTLLAAGRYRSRTPIGTAEVADFNIRGIHILAFRSEDGSVTPTLKSPHTYDAVICGPYDEVRKTIVSKDGSPAQPALYRGVEVAKGKRVE